MNITRGPDLSKQNQNNKLYINFDIITQICIRPPSALFFFIFEEQGGSTFFTVALIS